MATPIISSLLDTDLYKLTMMQCVFHQLPTIEAKYEFYCRKPIDLTRIKEMVQNEINALCGLSFQSDELKYLQSLPYISADFLDFLATFRLNPKYVTVDADNQLRIDIKGPWLETILFEVPLLAIVSEYYYRSQYPGHSLQPGREKLNQKIELINQQAQPNEFFFSDFGSRRRFSKAWQSEVLKTLKKALPNHLIGTSNVFFAKSLNLTPIGTMAHEYLQAFQSITDDIRQSQSEALYTWLKEYNGQLSIALTDVLGINQFLKEFNLELSQKFSGVRHDSGDPFKWTDKMLAHYANLNIDARDKTLVFSDSLTMEKALTISNYAKNKAKITFGIGTHLMNDVGLLPLDIVIKMTAANDIAVIKYPDSKGKVISIDQNRLDELRATLHLKE